MRSDKGLAIFIVLLSFFSFCCDLAAIEKPGEELVATKLTTVLGNKVDLGLQFTTSAGEKVKLSELLTDRKPLVIVPVYYKCPRLCGLLLDGVTRALPELSLVLGKEYQVLTISFDSSETSDLAAKRAEHYRGRLPEEIGDKEGWRFLVGDEANVSALMKQIGFNYERDKDDFVHTAVLMVLTPHGEISQYFTGIDFPAWDLRMALVDAAKGSIGNMLDHVYLFCFRFDPTKGKYTWAAFNIMRLGGVLTLSFLGILVFKLLRKEQQLKRKG
ncbi:MAG: SCO family protein [Bdellovibrionales bacterium]|nr:SCO family protein [Bdellovibrionales bacterium]